MKLNRQNGLRVELLRAGLLIWVSLLAGCSNRLADGVPRLYACERAEGLNSCPGGWRCGLSGFCQDPTQALPYACEGHDDCSAAWHCGAERLCYDRATALDRPCRTDADDCAPARPLRAPANERSLQGNEAVARPTVGSVATSSL